MVFTQEKVQFQQIWNPTDVSFYLSKTSLWPVSAQSESFKINSMGEKKKQTCTQKNDPEKQNQKNFYFKIAVATKAHSLEKFRLL